MIYVIRAHETRPSGASCAMDFTSPESSMRRNLCASARRRDTRGTVVGRWRRCAGASVRRPHFALHQGVLLGRTQAAVRRSDALVLNGSQGDAVERCPSAGTPEFAERALARLLQAGHDVALVLTQPDRPAGAA